MLSEYHSLKFDCVKLIHSSFWCSSTRGVNVTISNPDRSRIWWAATSKRGIVTKGKLVPPICLGLATPVISNDIASMWDRKAENL